MQSSKLFTKFTSNSIFEFNHLTCGKTTRQSGLKNHINAWSGRASMIRLLQRCGIRISVLPWNKLYSLQWSQSFLSNCIKLTWKCYTILFVLFSNSIRTKGVWEMALIIVCTALVLSASRPIYLSISADRFSSPGCFGLCIFSLAHAHMSKTWACYFCGKWSERPCTALRERPILQYSIH